MARREHGPARPASGKRWLQDYSTVSNWMQQYDLLALLEKHGGLCQIKNFLPAHVAEHAFELVGHVPAHSWNSTAADEDYGQNNIEHMFWSSKHAKPLQDLLRIFSLLLPDKLQTFSAARYDTNHHIGPHDDRAYTKVMMGDGQIVECSRQVAVIYYLTKGWRAEWGGHLLDLEGHATLVPEFNSVVAFTIPRFHQVTPVTGPHPRYSVFGWFLEPGHLYKLFTGDEQQQHQQLFQQQQQQQQHQQQQQQQPSSSGRLPSRGGVAGEGKAGSLPTAKRRKQQPSTSQEQASCSSMGSGGDEVALEQEVEQHDTGRRDELDMEAGRKGRKGQGADGCSSAGPAGLPGECHAQDHGPTGSRPVRMQAEQGHDSAGSSSGKRSRASSGNRMNEGHCPAMQPVARRGILRLVNRI